MYDNMLKGPSLAPASGRPAKSLVVFLHGYGSNGQDLISLAPYMQNILPDTEFLSPNAPFRWQGVPFTRGYQWFELGLMDPGHILKGVRQALPILNSFLDAELMARNLTDDKLALVGFSQGTMMALQTALTRSHTCAGVLGFSGAFYPDPLQPVKSKPPVMLIHGELDTVLSMDFFNNAVEELLSIGIEPETHLRKMLGHGIDPEGLKLGTDFLKKVLYT